MRLRKILPLAAAATLLSSTASATTETEPSTLLEKLQRASNSSLLWGPYNPSLYFGMRPRIPNSIFTGLMWSRVEDFQTVQNTFRHTCEQGDDMAGYGWEEYDGRAGGKQVIRDQKNLIDIETTLVKVPGGEHGGSWGVRIKGIPRADAPATLRTSLMFYIGSHVDLDALNLQNTPDSVGLEGPVVINGAAPGLGEFEFEITTGPETNRAPIAVHPELEKDQDLKLTQFRSVRIPSKELWRVKSVFFGILQRRFQALIARFGKDAHPPPWQTFVIDNDFTEGNLHLIQKVFEGPFEFDVLYSSKSNPTEMTSELLTKHIKPQSNSFLSRFNAAFPRSAPFNTEKYQTFAHSLFSNLLGGIGFFHGSSLVDLSEYPEDDEMFWLEAKENREKGNHKEGPISSLFTSIPSRPFFPRGFYWDEGFHLIPVANWDWDLTLDIVKSWFGQMDEDGWIAREQILGEEARSKVPAEFQIQYPHYANPPTLFFILTKFIDKVWSAPPTDPITDITLDNLPNAILTSKETASAYLKELYPKLRLHYQWFKSTQTGEIRAYDREAFSSKEAYRWRGRAPGYCLTSGIDDYPRAEPPHPGELHVDLMSWMGAMTRCMRRIAEILDETDDLKEYTKSEVAILRNIDDLHWDEKKKMYCDLTVDEYEESKSVCHAGYVSLFPFFVGLLSPESEKLSYVLDMIEDEDQLWSPFGLRSLSRKDEFYSTGENYWRGPIWVNMNYLAIERLQEFGSIPGPEQKRAAKMYSALRKNVVQNVYEVWKKTGFAWEQYEQETGNAKGVQHFLGWTSLVVSIMGMPESVGLEKLHDEL